jgi:hypothetical protein
MLFDLRFRDAGSCLILAGGFIVFERRASGKNPVFRKQSGRLTKILSLGRFPGYPGLPSTSWRWRRVLPWARPAAK